MLSDSSAIGPCSSGARPVGEIWSQQDSRGLTARELIRLAQAVRLRSTRPPG